MADNAYQSKNKAMMLKELCSSGRRNEQPRILKNWLSSKTKQLGSNASVGEVTVPHWPLKGSTKLHEIETYSTSSWWLKLQFHLNTTCGLMDTVKFHFTLFILLILFKLYKYWNIHIYTLLLCIYLYTYDHYSACHCFLHFWWNPKLHFIV